MAKINNASTREEAHRLFSYSQQTGELLRRTGPNAGQAAGCDNGGYKQIWIAGKNYFAHRIVWLMNFGKFPDGVIDHINGNKSDNRLCNLRDIPHRFNIENQRSATVRNKSSSHLGVKRRASGKWAASIKTGGKDIWLGSFPDEESAACAYIEAKRKFHAGCML
jgi:hypothetical protein